MRRPFVFLLAFLWSAAAFAAPPPGIEAMLRAAKPGELATVAKVAKRVEPQSARAIDKLVANLKKERAAAKRERLAALGYFEGWNGEGALGGSISTGNTDELGLSASLELGREGIEWDHELQLAADFRETNDIRTRERFFAQYIGRYDLSRDLYFAFGALSFERDRFSGISWRFTESLGVGYRIARSDTLRWLVEGGPALRQTKFTNGERENQLELLGRTDIEWKIAETVMLSEEAGFLVGGGGNNSFFSKSAATAQLIGDLSARLSFDILHETSPPAGREETDTITRASLVYDF